MSALRHAHAKQDEFVYVLQGTATLNTDEGAMKSCPACALASAREPATLIICQRDGPGRCLPRDRGQNARRLRRWPDDDLQVIEVRARNAWRTATERHTEVLARGPMPSDDAQPFGQADALRPAASAGGYSNGRFSRSSQFAVAGNIEAWLSQSSATSSDGSLSTVHPSSSKSILRCCRPNSER